MHSIEHTTLIVISNIAVQKFCIGNGHIRTRASTTDSYVVFLEERVTVKVANEKPAKKARETNTAQTEMAIIWISHRQLQPRHSCADAAAHQHYSLTFFSDNDRVHHVHVRQSCFRHTITQATRNLSCRDGTKVLPQSVSCG